MANSPYAWLAAASKPRDGNSRTVMTVHAQAIWSVALTMPLAFLPVAVDARQTASITTVLPLQSMSYTDAKRAGAVGTGCTWRGGPDRKARLSMADDRAVVRRNGVFVALRPSAKSKALFFTHDRWTGGGITILVHDTGKVVRRGHEFTETIARVDVIERGRTASFVGRLNCGS